ncbi:RecX family transcriptional regulator [Sphingomonas naasensis]|uniref:RecX family transcriptional regulator n=1 Tax=Sphingomonas naasensis TaxID=1344951 RepID=A0A4S1W457_9SPHN|nr:RecX family transcriptional regulator [Sphingomonas naasensis]TGX37621.1 RecX family transcriptional regulator [Sphingomonas naasensis]
MTRMRRPLTPLNEADLERLALRYVERYATTRGRLSDYLRRKIRERGWAGAGSPAPDEVAQAMADRGYVDDRLFAETRAGAMTRRGFGARRVNEALRHAGIEAADAEAVAPAIAADAPASAIAFARRKRIGPFGREVPDRPQREKQLAAMLRAGHGMDISRKIIGMAPGDDIEALIAVPEWDRF